MKRLFSLLLSAALLLLPGAALAEFDYSSIPTPNILVVDGHDTSTVFYERNADQRAFPASTTKIMTCILAIESGNLDDQVTVGDEVTPFTNYSSLMGLKSGETVTMRDLVYGLMLPSGNDAGAAIAVHIAGSIDAFVERMNAKAQELGMTGTHYKNPHGTHNDDHYTTARDLAKLMAYAIQNEEFRKVDATKTYTVPASNLRSEPLVLTTTNRLLQAVAGDPVDTVYPYAVGGKTGDTDMAGKCFVAVAERDGAEVIVVLLGDKAPLYGDDKVTTNLARFVNSKAIFEAVFDSEYQTVTPEELGLASTFTQDIANASPANLVDGKIPLRAEISGSVIRDLSSKIAAYRANAAAIQPEIDLYEPLQAPVNAGQAVGTVRYMLSGETVFSAPLIADVTVAVEVSAGGTVVPENPEDVIAPTEDPLIHNGRKEWGTADFLVLALVLLVVLLIALVVVFVVTERKRRYERKRRAARARKRRRYE